MDGRSGNVTYSGKTCGVDEAMTACVLADHFQQHGFVLSPNGGWTFW